VIYDSLVDDARTELERRNQFGVSHDGPCSHFRDEQKGDNLRSLHRCFRCDPSRFHPLVAGSPKRALQQKVDNLAVEHLELAAVPSPCTATAAGRGSGRPPLPLSLETGMEMLTRLSATQ
jgi:hypothetical protein